MSAGWQGRRGNALIVRVSPRARALVFALSVLARGCGDTATRPQLQPGFAPYRPDAAAYDAATGHADASGSAPDAAVPNGACCTTREQPGCEVASVQECVCKSVPDCCTGKWDLVCVQLVDSLGCGSCKGDCCAASTTKGCDQPQIQACVCMAQPQCCNDHWDEFCTLSVDGLKCGTCN